MAPTMKMMPAAVCSIQAPSEKGSWIDVCGMAATAPAATDMRNTGTHQVRLAGCGSSRWRGAGSGVEQGMRQGREVMAMLHC